MRTILLAALALVAALGLGGCAGTGGSRTSPAVVDTGLDRMERLALNANRCWFKSKDPAFASYSLAPELSSFSGRPRFLLVPRGKPEARPLLVVEGQSGSGNVTVYGPLTSDPVGPRIGRDIDRWRGGANDCGAA
ncbi:hypothetical protein NPA31_005600 [Aurantimonas sp. MSK8Z-1]|uniref:hypothetical protein n=1 Tax=Mangrovibrevibacter kandeliae TaxID=2968473 RepID=UPI00211891F1|nr:hypothetical protein [Aurantimonas sp. MSK8Z-1]MCW4114437.1 hypothetical protein [Aurantimonas sp. MSK8Z-1]